MPLIRGGAEHTTPPANGSAPSGSPPPGWWSAEGDVGSIDFHPEEQTAIQLVYGKGITLAEVAREIGVHVNTAKNRHPSALRKLRAPGGARGMGL